MGRFFYIAYFFKILYNYLIRSFGKNISKSEGPIAQFLPRS